MNEWSKEQLEEMVGDDIINQLAFVSGCFKHRYCNDKSIPDGWIISDEMLRKFAELIIQECAAICVKQSLHYVERIGRGGASGAASALSYIIKMHFGVEE